MRFLSGDGESRQCVTTNSIITRNGSKITIGIDAIQTRKKNGQALKNILFLFLFNFNFDLFVGTWNIRESFRI